MVIYNKDERRWQMKYKITSERTNLFAPNIHVAMSVLIKGCTDLEELTHAIRKACIQNEMLRCKIVLEENGEAFYETISTPNQSIIIRENSNANQWISIIKEQENFPFDIFHGELVRFFLLKEAEHIRLLLIAHHLAGDGISYTYLIEDIMRGLQKESELAPKPMTLFDAKNLSKKHQLSLAMKLMIRYLNRSWKKYGKVFDQEDYDRIYTSYWSNRSTEIYTHSFQEEKVLKLKEKADKCNITLNTLIQTVMLHGYHEKADVGLAVSIRPKGFKGMANFASGIAFDYQYSSYKTFAENAKAVHHRIQRKLKNDKKRYFLLQFLDALEATLIDSTYFAAFAGYEEKLAKKLCKMFGYCGKPKDLSISNLTKLDIPTAYGEYSIEDFWFVPPLISNAKRLFGIASLGNTMNLTFHVENSKERDNLKRYFDEVIHELLSFTT